MGFIKQFWDYIASFSFGIKYVDQYAQTSEGHFSNSKWHVIYESTLKSHTNHKKKVYAGQTILLRYTHYCYSFESRTCDNNKFISLTDPSLYVNSIEYFYEMLRVFRLGSPYYDYFILLEISRCWSPEERIDFLRQKNCINGFLAPIYERITKGIIISAWVHHDMFIDGRTLKRSTTDVSEPRTDNKKAIIVPKRSKPDIGLKTMWNTDKFTKAFGKWYKYIKACD